MRLGSKLVSGIFWGVLLGALILMVSNPGGRSTLQSGYRWSKNVASIAQEKVEGYLGEQYMLRRQTRKTIRQLEQEIERLQWIEAKASTSDTLLDEDLAQLEAHQETTRQGLVQLAVWVESGRPATMADGSVKSVAELEQMATETMLEFSAVEEQIALYRQTYEMQQEAATKARSLWMEADRSIDKLEAYLALLEANIALQEANGSIAGSATKDGVEATSAGLAAQIERDQRITDKRRELEAGIQSVLTESDGDTVLIESPLEASRSLAEELRDLAVRK